MAACSLLAQNILFTAGFSRTYEGGAAPIVFYTSKLPYESLIASGTLKHCIVCIGFSAEGAPHAMCSQKLWSFVSLQHLVSSLRVGLQ